MVIYADEVFAVNFVSSYIMLYILGKVINKVKIKKIKITLAAIFSSAAATAVFCIEMPTWCTYALRIASLIISILIAFFELRKKILTQIAYFALMSGIAVISVIFTASVLAEKTSIISKAGILYINIPPLMFTVCFVLSYLVLAAVVKLIKRGKAKKYYNITVTLNGKEIKVKALFDSGNMLKEPISGKCVTIIEWDEAKKLFALSYSYDEIGEHIEEMKLRVIPFRSLGNPSGTIFGFMADSIKIDEEQKTINKTFIGLCGTELSKNKEYHALINASLI